MDFDTFLKYTEEIYEKTGYLRKIEFRINRGCYLKNKHLLADFKIKIRKMKKYIFYIAIPTSESAAQLHKYDVLCLVSKGKFTEWECKKKNNYFIGVYNKIKYNKN